MPRNVSSTSREVSKSNGSRAFAERPRWDGSGIASTTPVIVASTELPITTVLPIGFSAPNRRVA